jgi:hypothetical protein
VFSLLGSRLGWSNPSLESTILSLWNGAAYSVPLCSGSFATFFIYRHSQLKVALRVRDTLNLGFRMMLELLRLWGPLGLDEMHLHYEMTTGLWVPGGKYYGLSVKCPLKAWVLNAWSLASGTVLVGSGNFRGWDWVGGGRSLGHTFEGDTCSLLSVCHEVNSLLFHVLPHPWHSVSPWAYNRPWTETCESMS